MCSARNVPRPGRLGAKVAILDLNQANAENWRRNYTKRRYRVGVTCNVLDKESVKAACEQVLVAFGKVDILINGAGATKPRPPQALSYHFSIYPKTLYGGCLS